MNRNIDNAIAVAKLIDKLRNNSISEKELNILKDWLHKDQKNLELFRSLSDPDEFGRDLKNVITYSNEDFVDRVTNMLDDKDLNKDDSIVSNPNKGYWYYAAATILIVLCIGFAVYWQQGTSKKANPDLSKGINDTTTPIKPGGNKAVLTLSNGKSIWLDTTANGQLGQDNIVKKDDGVIAYSGSTVSLQHNTVTTPRGGQYRVILEDGTKVWINAASEFRFPVSFVQDKREVFLKGEAYFEVAKNAEKPFIVHVNGSSIKVLGTHFNVMAYEEEKKIRTTLAEGSIMLNHEGKDSVVLRPGFQADIVSSSENIKVAKADLAETLAWTKGLFLFKSTDINSIMRQVSRWYDLQVVSEGDLSDVKFSGSLKRQENIADLLDILATDGRIRFRTKGHTITMTKQ
ncbi:MAG: hypothetical protein DI598_12400 [Pseudopedobacter saltans]|uniref:Anti-FecI sigma factor, FecR n=1 Tax=Pseudopedobacter saltans TaxID=151895 RepID=A0A2W5EQ99_9SPHI|nr:MAG: hypothetical protein DI598_12400 [Pseudopedobacter saltans]